MDPTGRTALIGGYLTLFDPSWLTCAEAEDQAELAKLQRQLANLERRTALVEAKMAEVSARAAAKAEALARLRSTGEFDPILIPNCDDLIAKAQQKELRRHRPKLDKAELAKEFGPAWRVVRAQQRGDVDRVTLERKMDAPPIPDVAVAIRTRVARTAATDVMSWNGAPPIEPSRFTGQPTASPDTS